MTFPILNISTEKWNADDLTDYISFDKFIYTSKDSLFKELYEDQLFCDCNGLVFKAIKKAEMTQKWRNWLRFLPNVWKTEIIFNKTNEKLTVEQLRNYLLERISDLRQDDFTRKWKEDLKKAKTHSEIINMES